MSDSPPPVTTTPTPKETVTMKANQPEKPTKAEDTNESKQNVDTHQEFSPCCGAAIFSTELGTRPARPVSGPPYPPVIVRGSDPVKAVVDAAAFFQRKFKWQCLCIFPGQKWGVEDLWDDEDIHVDSRSFCEKMLTFIERDTYYAAKQFGEDWLRAHPDRLDDVQGNMMDAFDPSKPFAVIDKMFIYGETNGFPRTFLYHVAQIMRITMVNTGQTKKAALMANNLRQPPRNEHQDVNEPDPITSVSDAEALITGKPSTTQHNGSKEMPSKSSTPIDTSVATLGVPPAVPNQSGSHPTPKRVPTYGQPQPNYHTEPVGSYMGGMTGHSVISPSLHPQTLKVPKGKPRHMRSGSYSQSMASHGWAENSSRNPSGPYPHHTPGTVSNVHSPQSLSATMAMGQPMMIPPHAIPPYVQGTQMMWPPIPNQHFDVAMVPRGMALGGPMPMPAPPMGQPFLHHPPQAYDARRLSMGDMTNSIYYSANLPAQHVDPRGTMQRRASHFNHNGVLYDPYNGANAKFNEATAYNGSKKAMIGSTPHQLGRPRKVSAPGNRSGHAPHGVQQPGDLPVYMPRHSEYNGFRKGRCEDDQTVTQDHVAGCHDTWIGPLNETVMELFVGDLPEDVQGHELRELFEHQTGMSPSQIEIKYPEHHSHHHRPRLHAFVSFSSASDARKALEIRDRHPCIRQGSITVTVSVPRRFFQRTLNSVRRDPVMSDPSYGPAFSVQPDEQNALDTAQVPSRNEQNVVTNPQAPDGHTQYSPQDARSDLPKGARKLISSNPSLTGSPETHKSRQLQISPTKIHAAKRTAPKRTDIETKVAKVTPGADASESCPAVAEAVSNKINTQSKKLHQDVTKSSEPVVTNEPSIMDLSTLLVNNSEAFGKETVDETTQSTQIQGDNDDREKSRDQANLELSIIETKTPSVKLPSIPADILRSVDQSVTEITALNGEATGRATVAFGGVAENVASEDEEQHDNSFHSAPESQTYVGNASSQPEARDDTVSMNHGSDLIVSPIDGFPAPKITNKSLTKPRGLRGENFVSHYTNLEQDRATRSETNATIPSETDHMAVTTPTATIESSQDVSVAPERTSDVAPMQNLVTAPASTVGPKAVSTTLPAVDALKKAGAQTIESLSPFAKPSKAQQKKDRELKKKQQKKMEAEKVTKAKLEKTASSTKPNANSTATTKTGPSHSPNIATAGLYVPAKLTAIQQDTYRQTAEGAKMQKDKHKVETASNVDQVQKMVGECEDSGKRNGGTSTHIPPETGSITHKMEVSQVANAKTMAQIPLPVGASDVQSSEDVPVETQNCSQSFCNPVVDSPGPPVEPTDAQALLKPSKPAPAVLSLHLHSRIPSTHSQGTLLDSNGASTTIAWPSIVPTDFDPDVSQPTPEASSVASSVTLQAEETAKMSPPTNDEGIVTAQQTPITPVHVQDVPSKVETANVNMPQGEVSKKKKKKPKKKSKKLAKAVVKASEPTESKEPDSADIDGSALSECGSGIGEDYDLYDPFNSQLSHIDAIRRSLKNEDSYFAQANARMKADNDMKTDHAEKMKTACHAQIDDVISQLRTNGRQLSEPDLMRQIEGYIMENGSRFLSGAKKLSKNDVK